MYWSDPIIATDHQLLHTSRVDTGKTVMLPARVPIGRKLPTLVQCRIYQLDTGATIAIGKYDDLTIIFLKKRDRFPDFSSLGRYTPNKEVLTMTEKEFNNLLLTWGRPTDTPEWRDQLNEEERTLIAKWDASLAKARAILAAEMAGEGPAEEPVEDSWGVLDFVLLNLRLRYLRFDEYAEHGAHDKQTKEKYYFAMEQLDWAVSLIQKAQNGEFDQYVHSWARQNEMGR